INWWQPKVLKKQRVAFCLMRAGSPANTGEAGAIHRASSDLYRTFTSVLTLSGNDCGLIS
ncbi:hypothetical protein QVM41_32700, partial [Pseudomonas shirazica]|uniref:hypothetical protein n=1 Tax=Pseudomonas shirazica TaxID=1940636 RepID=UPI0035243595